MRQFKNKHAKFVNNHESPTYGFNFSRNEWKFSLNGKVGTNRSQAYKRRNYPVETKEYFRDNWVTTYVLVH